MEKIVLLFMVLLLLPVASSQLIDLKDCSREKCEVDDINYSNKRIDYNSNWARSSITLDGFDSTEAIVSRNGTKYKYGFNITSRTDELRRHKLTLQTNNNLIVLNISLPLENVTYPKAYQYQPSNNWNEKRVWYDFYDVCSKNYSNCEWEQQGNRLDVSFISYNFIDPTIQNVSSCQTLTNQSVTYTLNQNLTSSTTCIVIGNDSITFDMAGYSINGTDSANEFGIYAVSRNHSIIANGTVRDYYNGVYFQNPYNMTIENITAYSHTSFGLYLLNGVGYNIINNFIANNNVYGIYVPNSDYNNFTNITSNSNSFVGFYNSGSDNLIVKNMEINSVFTGILLQNPIENITLTNISVNGTASDGYSIGNNGNNFNLINFSFTNCGAGDCMDIKESDNGYYKNGYISGGTGRGIYIFSEPGSGQDHADNNYFQDVLIENFDGTDIYMTDDLTSADIYNTTFVNVTYNLSSQFIESDGEVELFRYYYYWAKSNFTSQENYEGGDLNIYWNNDTLFNTYTTNASGYIQRVELLDYSYIDEVETYYNNYTLNITYKDQVLEQSLNVTFELNSMDNLFTFNRTIQTILRLLPRRNKVPYVNITL